MPNLILNLAAAAAAEPGGAIEAFKNVVNRISVPELSLPIFFLLFIVMMLAYRQWTRPAVALGLLVVFCVFYFGSMLIDADYKAVIQKPDNVPITIMLLGTGICLWVAFRQAAANDDRIKAGLPIAGEDKDDKVLVWPDLVYSELICLVLASALLILWSILLRAPLESPANPAGPPNPSKAPWYFLGLQEMLVYFDPWMAGVLLPTLIISGMIAMPYIDTNPKGNGYYTVRERPFALGVWLFGFLILWVVLIVFGTFLRGPNWNFFGPYEYWDATRVVPLTNINMSDYFWNGKPLLGFGMNRPLPTNAFVREISGLVFTGFWIFILPFFIMPRIMWRMYRQMGPGRFYFMAIHFVIMGLLPLKMLLRWTMNLKYFVYLPEFNLNL